MNNPNITVNTTESRVEGSRIWMMGGIATVAATVANAIIFLIAQALGFFPDTVKVQPANEPFSIVPVIGVTVVAGIVATVLFYALNRFTKQPVRIFLIISAIVFLLEDALVFTIAGAPAGMIVSLLLMHVVAAAIIVWMLAYQTRRS